MAVTNVKIHVVATKKFVGFRNSALPEHYLLETLNICVGKNCYFIIVQ